MLSLNLNLIIQANLTDIISVNHYFGWYQATGRLELIAYQLRDDIQNWHNKYKKPIIFTEYGAESFVGVHCVNYYFLFSSLC